MVFNNESVTIPERLETEMFLLRPLRATDVELDYAAVMESKEFLRKWDQSSWPQDDFTIAGNLKDLQRHECEHINRESFTFTVMNPSETECLGCVYIYPRTVNWLRNTEMQPVGEARVTDYEAVVLFWIRQSRLTEGMDRQLLDLLCAWFEQEWTFDGYLFLTNEEFEQQVAMFEEAGLQLQVEIRPPKRTGNFRAYTPPLQTV